jgi:catechol 2,3-dioxygenase-like lactoylglutathione lyase family enzyme
LRNLIKHRFIAIGFAAWTWSLRVRRVLANLGRPRLRLVDHVTIPVKDLAVAREFYCGVLGGRLMLTIDAAALRRFGRPPAERDGDGVYHDSVLLGGATRIDLFLQSSGQPAPTQGHPHIAFRVPPGDMLAWKRRLAAHGVPTEGPLRLGFPGQASLYFNDPSGNHLEVTCTGYGPDIPLRPPQLGGLTY